jgi:hypothetical protein
MSEPVQDKRIRLQERLVGKHYGEPIVLKGLQLSLSALVILVIGIDRSVGSTRNLVPVDSVDFFWTPALACFRC